MEEVTKSCKVIKISNYKKEHVDQSIVSESTLEMFVNDGKVATFLCTPKDQELLAVGFLQSEGWIKSARDIDRLDISDEGERIKVYTKNETKIKNDFLQERIITSTSAKGILSINKRDPSLLGGYAEEGESYLKVFLTMKEVIALMNEFEDRCLLYKATHGVHNAAIANKEGILFFYEDIGRHNAIDKVFGKCLMEEMNMEDKILITSGRISSEIMFKIIRRNIPVVLTKATPTNIAMSIAEKLAITLIGFVQDRTMIVYTSPLRVERG